MFSARRSLDLQALEAEVAELIKNSKSKRLTVFEPCDRKNLPQYLKSVEEELNLYGISYFHDPHLDLEDPENLMTTLVNLINGTWGIIMEYKKNDANMKSMKSHSYTLQQNNNVLTKTVEIQKKELELANREIKDLSRVKLELTQKIQTIQYDLDTLRKETARLKKASSTTKMQSASQLRKAENDFVKLENKFRGQCGVYSGKNEIKNVMIEEFRKKELMYKDTIRKLEDANFKLLIELEKSTLEELSDSE